MKNFNKLDELFEQARNSKAQFSIEQSRNLIESFNQNKFNFKIIKGNNIMTWLSLAIATTTVAGLITYNSFFKDDNGNVIQKENNLEIVTDSPNNQENLVDKIEQSNVETKQDIKVEVKTEKIEGNPKHNQNSGEHIKVVKIMNRDFVKGVKMIELTNDELKNLGIIVAEDGSCLKYRDNINGKQKEMTVYVDFGISLNDSIQSISTSKVIAPKLITDNDGNRRMMKLDDDGLTLIQSEYRKFTFADSNSQMHFSDVTSILPDQDNQLNFKKIDIDIIDKDLNLNKIFKNIQHNKIQIDTITIFSNDDENSDFNLRHFDFDRNDPKKVLDSSKHTSIVIIKDCNIDTSETSSQIKKIIVQSNSESKTDISVEKNIQVQVACNSNNKQNNNNTIIPFDMEKMEERRIEANQKFDKMLEINKLLPVTVSIKNAKLHDGTTIDNFQFILWFEPSSEVLANLPERIRTQIEPELLALNNSKNVCETSSVIAGKDNYFDVWRACSGAIENLSLNPNPTNDIVNVKFKLEESRNITISLHDLSGSKIYDFASNLDLSAGEINLTYKMNNYEPGMYLIVVKSTNGEQAVQRLIKQ